MDGAERPVCVLWVGEAGAVPSSLVVILRDQGLEVVVAREAPEVMMELGEASGARAGRAGDATVVMVEPTGRPRAGELLRAIERYHPDVVCWRYEAVVDGAGPQLLPMDPASVGGPRDASGLEPAERGPNARVKGARRRLRSLVVRVDGSAGGVMGDNAAAGAAAPLVSEAELAMLLRPVRDETDGRERGLQGA